MDSVDSNFVVIVSDGNQAMSTTDGCANTEENAVAHSLSFRAEKKTQLPSDRKIHETSTSLPSSPVHSNHSPITARRSRILKVLESSYETIYDRRSSREGLGEARSVLSPHTENDFNTIDYL
ncbi:unnamed protein product [Calicophoron daubneyi]|uniref:Uncharacterized protein n=1 Tax=Calicophoron daubneyi TaxID=300641 RepID=A0AAV2TGV9_CALDB